MVEREEVAPTIKCTVDPEAEAAEAVIAHTGSAVDLIGYFVVVGSRRARSRSRQRRREPLSQAILRRAASERRQCGRSRCRRCGTVMAKSYAAGERDAARRVIDLLQAQELRPNAAACANT